MNNTTIDVSVALESLLQYAKYLEDNKSLSYGLLRQRVDTYTKSLEKKEAL